MQAPQEPKAGRCDGNPIYALTGAKKEFVRTEVSIGGLDLVLTYDSTGKLPANQAVEQAGFADSNVLGALWKSSLHHTLQVAPNLKKAHFTKGDGTILGFDGNGAGVFTGEAGNPHKLVSISGGYRYTDTISGDVETFDTAGKLQSIATRSGQVLTYTYSGELPVKIQTAEGRELTLSYSTGLLSQITAPDGRVLGLSYDGSKNLTSMTWADTKVRGFLYENSALPWALTGVVDENGSRRSTFTYDSLGRALSTEYAGGVNKFSVAYAKPPQRQIVETFDSVNNVLYRTQSWQIPSGTTVTQSNGQSVAIQAISVRGQPAIAAQSQAAGSGCSAATNAQTYDAAGNIASNDDFLGQRTCYAYDASHRETVRVEGLSPSVACSSVTGVGASLPTGTRKITTSWHADWKLPTQVDEPGRRTTTVYHGQPDPFNGNAIASCSPTAAMPSGKPLPLVCKIVEQALLGAGSVDSSAPTQTISYSYNSSGRLLSSIDPRSQLTSYAYFSSTQFSGVAPVEIGHTVGDLQSITNAAGHVTQFTQYDRAGRVRQMIDPKGVVTEITYTPRGWVSTVTTTAPGSSARVTSYTYDGAGQLTGVAHPDGSSLSYSYDAAHRLVGVTDAKGNSISYTLDNAGNKVSEEIKDPNGGLQRSISRSFDALSRVQQVIGAAQ